MIVTERQVLEARQREVTASITQQIVCSPPDSIGTGLLIRIQDPDSVLSAELQVESLRDFSRSA